MMIAKMMASNMDIDNPESIEIGRLWYEGGKLMSSLPEEGWPIEQLSKPVVDRQTGEVYTVTDGDAFLEALRWRYDGTYVWLEVEEE